MLNSQGVTYLKNELSGRKCGGSIGRGGNKEEWALLELSRH